MRFYVLIYLFWLFWESSWNPRFSRTAAEEPSRSSKFNNRNPTDFSHLSNDFHATLVSRHVHMCLVYGLPSCLIKFSLWSTIYSFCINYFLMRGVEVS